MTIDIRFHGATHWLVLLGIFGFAFSGNAQISFKAIQGYLDQGLRYSSLAFGDIDRDGDLDVFLTGGQGLENRFGLYRLNSLGFYHVVEGRQPFVATRYGSADFEDVDNDGDPDLLITGQTIEGVEIARLYRNTATGTFLEEANTPFLGVTTSAAVFADFNNDGAPDVIIAGSSGGIPVTNLYYNDGQGNFNLSLGNIFAGVKGADIAVADVDNDNDTDILLAGVNSELEHVSLLYRNNGGIFSKASGTAFAGIDDGSLAFGDIDGDSDVDLILIGTGNDGTGVSKLYRNNGAGEFSEVENTPFPLLLYAKVAMEDIDGDGDLDIFMTGNPYTSDLFLNDGTGVFSPYRIPPITTMNYGTFEIADLNHDGRPDILMTGMFRYVGRTTFLFRNETLINKPPAVSEVIISGVPEVGEELQGSYAFVDADGDVDQSTYRWYRSAYSSGINKTIIPEASAATYMVTAADENKYLSIEITPHDGTVAGMTVSSRFVGPVVIPIPDMNVIGNGIYIENGSEIPSTENHTQFDEVAYAGGTSSRIFAIENTGSAELLVSGITISGAHASEFDLSPTIFPVSIEPGEEFQISINFHPSEAGDRNALISIRNNAKDEEIYTFKVSGEGLNAPPKFISEGITSFPENREGNLLDINAINGNGGAPDEGITYSITGGADRDKFFLDAEGGLLSFIIAPDFETPTDADINNEYLLEITADDGHSENNLSSQLISVLVLNLDEAPMAVCVGTFTVQLDSSGEATIVAAEVDGGSTDDSGAFSIAIHPSRFTCAEIGENEVILSVSDLSGNITTCSTTITIEDKIPPKVLTRNIEIPLDPEGKASIIPTDINSGSNDACGIDFMSVFPASFTCNDVGPNTVTLKVTDNNGNENSSTAIVMVIDDQPPLIGVVENIDVQSQEGLCGAFLDIAAPGVTDNCTVEAISGQRSDRLQLTDPFPVGETIITWRVKDLSGNEVEDVVQTIIVRDSEKPVITEAPRIIVYANERCGAYVDIIAPTVSDNCDTGVILGIRDDGKDLDAMFDVGRTIITWTVEDKNGNPAEPVVQEIQVLNEAPRDVFLTTVDVPQEIGTDVTVRADFRDQNIASASWKAYNGTSIIQQFVDEKAAGNEVSHTFYDLPAGVYSIVLELKDHCGVSSGEIIYEYIVIYDPNGGFVTGGGWIISPENPAYEYMQKSGKANFGFNAKYKNGNNDMHEVGGNTNFQFKAGDLHFKSSSHDDMSLVISGGFKATYKGRGTVNGNGDYKFMLTAIDAEQNGAYDEDLFRIKIWETVSNKVVYDNNIKNGIITEADNDDPVTNIGGGSIVIHKPKNNTKNQQEVILVPEILSENDSAIIQIYPNPMNNRAVVMFNLEATSREADLRIYDLNGREVILLFQGRIEGRRNYEVNFERGNLMAGIYICRLTTETGKVYQERLLLQ